MLSVTNLFFGLTFFIQYKSSHNLTTNFVLNTKVYLRTKQSSVSDSNLHISSNLRTYGESPTMSTFVINTIQSMQRRYLQNSNYSLPFLDTSSIGLLISSLSIWKDSLLKGHFPDTDTPWPDEYLSAAIKSVMTQLNLPQLTRRHPELVMPILRCILEMAADYHLRVESRTLQELNNGSVDQTNQYVNNNYFLTESGPSMPPSNYSLPAVQQDIAAIIAREFSSQWSPPLLGLSMLDDLYGPDHGLLSIGIPEVGDEAGSGGFGLFDGVWKHVGWEKLKEVQSRLKLMTELKSLIRTLGRRPSVLGREYKKTPPQLDSTDAPMSVSKSSRAPTVSNGLRRSDKIEGLLPSEMALLSKSTGQSGNPMNQSHVIRKLKLVFYAKMVEKMLGSYEISGWVDEKSKTKRRPWTHFEYLPTATGGPIIVCLDTSWSMAGPREGLAKAVVLECSILASKQHRPCYVIAFSGENNVAGFEIPLGATNKKSLLRLLDFLSCSFRGGTDVTGPLLKAIELLETAAEWASADILLLTDGELQTPPVHSSVLHKLSKYEIERGLEIHGLLVGKSESVPLEMLCTDFDGQNRVHNFLGKYDMLTMLQQHYFDNTN